MNSTAAGMSSSDIRSEARNSSSRLVSGIGYLKIPVTSTSQSSRTQVEYNVPESSKKNSGRLKFFALLMVKESLVMARMRAKCSESSKLSGKSGVPVRRWYVCCNVRRCV